METKDRAGTARRPARKAAPKKQTENPRAQQDVVYLPPKPFSRNRLVLRLATVAAVVIALLVGISLFFKVDPDKILVSGNNKYSAWDIVEASGIKGGENLLTFSRAGASGRIILNLPYVESVRFGIELPDTVKIEIEEIEVTYAIQDQSDNWWLISAGGKVVCQAEAGTQDSYTKLLGVKLSKPEAGSQVQAQADTQEGTAPVVVTNAQRLETVLDILEYLEQNGVIGQAASVDVSNLGDIELWYGSQYQVRLGDNTQLAYKISYMKRMIDGMDSYQSGILDLTFTTYPDKGGYKPLG